MKTISFAPLVARAAFALLLPICAALITSVLEAHGEGLSNQTGSIEGRVVSQDDLQPLAGAEVRVLPAAGGRARLSSTDANGYYRFAGLPAGAYRVMATRVGFVRAAV